ncbi:Tetracycline resistance protein, class C [compost metagenome]
MSRKPLFVLFIAIFTVMMGFGVVIPAMPYYARTLHGDAVFIGAMMASYSLAQFLIAPFWGRLSDRYGRKPFLILGLLGYAISFLWFGLANSLTGLLAARTLGGLLSAAVLPAAFATVSDVTTEENRAKGMGVVGAAMGLGMVFGPAIGGWLGHYGLSTPFYAASAIALLAALLTFAMLPESLPRQAAPPERTSFLQNLKATPATAWGILAVTFLSTFAFAGFETVFALFVQDRLVLDSTSSARTVGMLLAVMGLVSALVQGGLVGRLIKQTGERLVLVGGLGLMALTMVSVSATSASAFAFACILAVMGIAHGVQRPAISSAISKGAGSAQGAALGLMSSFDSLARVLGPLLAGVLYTMQVSLPFYASALALIAGVATLLMLRGQAKEQAA